MGALAQFVTAWRWRRLKPFHDAGYITRKERRQIMAGLQDIVGIRHLQQYEKQVHDFENRFAQTLGTRHAIGLANGTDALYLALQCAGVGPGKGVITTTNTWITTLTVIHELGGHCQFVDIDPQSGLMDHEKVDKAISADTVAILPVHMYGSMARMDALIDIARARGLAVIEDACQAVGTSMQGRAAGTWGDAGCFSFHATKLVGAPSDGGMLVTGHAHWHEAVRQRATASWDEALERQQARVPSRLPALTIPFLKTRLDGLQARVASRRDQWMQYQEALRGIKNLRLLTPPEPEGATYRNCIIVTPHRADIMKDCKHRNLPVQQVYPESAAFLQRLAASRQVDLPVSQELADSGLALPLGRQMQARHIDEVVRIVRQCHAR